MSLDEVMDDAIDGDFLRSIGAVRPMASASQTELALGRPIRGDDGNSTYPLLFMECGPDRRNGARVWSCFNYMKLLPKCPTKTEVLLLCKTLGIETDTAQTAQQRIVEQYGPITVLDAEICVFVAVAVPDGIATGVGGTLELALADLREDLRQESTSGARQRQSRRQQAFLEVFGEDYPSGDQ